MRNSKAKRWTKEFVAEEETDRNNRTLYPVMPSPLGKHWLYYVKHRLRMLKKGIATYTTAKYARLSLDKYIRSSSVVDNYVGKLVGNQSALVFLGDSGDTPADSPIQMKKHVRCPGTRKLIKAFEKRSNCIVIRVDEWGTSQTCAACLQRFTRGHKSDKFKVCVGCKRKPITLLPTEIVTQVGKRTLQEFRKLERLLHADREAEPALMPKVQKYTKNWTFDLATGELENAAAEHWFDGDRERQEHVTVWQRDIVAAKNIMLKGISIDFFNASVNDLIDCYDFTFSRIMDIGEPAHTAGNEPTSTQH